MEAAAIAVCPISGAISVLSGQVEGGSTPEPLWRFSLGTWKPYSQIIEGSP
jgi:hypothetical protein